MKTVAIVIPTQKSILNQNDFISLKHLDKYLLKYDKFFVIPDNIEPANFRLKGYRFLKFPHKYFNSTKSYSKLLLTDNFYLKFKNYRYILIYQLDALVFSNQLGEWCNKGYDFIGAPWLDSIIARLSKKEGLAKSGGNGGFSLRNVHKSLKVLERVGKMARRSSSNEWIQKLWFIIAVLKRKSHKIWLNAPATDYPFNEDGFWSLEAPKYLKNYKVAPFDLSLKFAFEKDPEKCFNLNNKQLPFGCHAWERYDKYFWQKYIES